VEPRGRLSRWWNRTVHDLRRLWEEPVLGVAVAGIFGLLLVFILYPLVRVLTVSLFPDGTLTLKLYREFLASWFIRQAFVNSVVMGVLTAVGGTAVGFLFAFTLTRTNVPGKGFLTLAAILPVISPPFVSALSIILLFGNNGLITRQLLGLQDTAIYGLRGLQIDARGFPNQGTWIAVRNAALVGVGLGAGPLVLRRHSAAAVYSAGDSAVSPGVSSSACQCFGP